ncbi:hypothetical protein GCM10010441_10740 [Kitasatospora paracochleata]|uniref:DUF6234 domain-containing protein n=1 Tax=Kitasatospora paracochleata TaxID=58354 RepID=A0ABT1J421_9ACTN|nr:DUF6234 family protein [Kitasatospora paracochleata]MCP2311501.1 hypothetical protein [Kitasatospora paracochleata]
MPEAPEFLSRGPQGWPASESRRSALAADRVRLFADSVFGIGLAVALGVVYLVGVLFIDLAARPFTANPKDPAAVAQRAAGERAADSHFVVWTAAFLLLTLTVAVLAARRKSPWTAGPQFVVAALLTLALVAVLRGPTADTPARPDPAAPICRSGSTCP